MNMGYGFLRTAYGQRPKGYFAYLKSLYGEQLTLHLSKGYISALENHQTKDIDWEKFRRHVQQRIRQENKLRLKTFMLSVMVGVVVLFSLIWLVREWFGM
jgi:hypothetical protein